MDNKLQYLLRSWCNQLYLSTIYHLSYSNNSFYLPFFLSLLADICFKADGAEIKGFLSQDENVLDIDLEDPKVKDATLKIQAVFGRILAMRKRTNTFKSNLEDNSKTSKPKVV